MEEILDKSEGGRKRKQTVDERVNTYIAEQFERTVKEKRTKDNTVTGNPTIGGSSSSTSMAVEPSLPQGAAGVKRKRDDEKDDDNEEMADINFMGVSDMCAPEAKELLE